MQRSQGQRQGNQFTGFVSGDGDLVVMVGSAPLPLREFLRREGLADGRDGRAAAKADAAYHGGRAETSIPSAASDT